MVQLLRMPSLGETMEWGILISHLVEEGGSFSIGDGLYEVENEKTTLVVEAMIEGTVARWAAPLGEELPVGTVIAVVVEPGAEFTPGEVDELLAREAGVEEEPEHNPKPNEESDSLDRSSESSSEGRRLRAMPKARVRAGELGINLSTVIGTGRGGSITLEDVEASGTSRLAEDGSDRGEQVKLGSVHRTMADRMAQSWAEIPHFTESNLVDGTGLLARNASTANEISLNDLLVAAVIRAVVRTPRVNVSYRDGSLVVYDDVNLAVAVATEEGLFAPVVKRAQDLELEQLAEEVHRVTTAAHQRTLTPEEVDTGTITISNLGMYGVDFGTPVVTHRQSAIVFFGSLKERPFVLDGLVVARPSLYVTVAFDHRAIDGLLGAQFLGALTEELEES